ncbi:MAG: holo-ACP synthase [Selenomonadaceae bacterium]|nr:holo-ACP synthase [Selenomonadaceae bacterium]
MIRGLGTDIVEIARVEKACRRESFKTFVFTEIEQAYCESRGKNSAASYAARFAAKEAFFKALGTGIVTRLSDVEIINDEHGAPNIFLRGKAETLAQSKGVEKISLSLSHSRDFATAVCIVE